MEGNERGPAVSGDLPAPAPDSIAGDYLLLALRVDALLPGLVDAYFGPAELKARVGAEPTRTASSLGEDASTLNSRLSKEAPSQDRQRWLRAQLVALEAQALMVAGDPLPFSDYVACLFDAPPHRAPEAVFESAADDIARLLPASRSPDETVAERLAAWEADFAIEPDRLPGVVEWLVGQMRERAGRLVGLPADEGVDFVYVSGGPWSAFSQYSGAGRTLIELNTERVRSPSGLIHMAATECYPGRHLERAWKERHLVRELGRLECSVTLLNTPEALMSEGVAMLGERIVAPDATLPELLIELYERGGLAVASDPARAREAADAQLRIRRARASLRSVPANAAFLLHADGAGRDEVAAYLRRYLMTSPERAEQRLALIEDPIGRAQVIGANEGERLVRRWFELGPVDDQPDRFVRLLREQLTPGALTDELSSAGFGEDGW